MSFEESFQFQLIENNSTEGSEAGSGVEGLDSMDPLNQLDTPAASQWTDDEEVLLKTFFQKNPKLLKTDERGRKQRDKLWMDLQLSLQFKFTAEEVRLKLLDIAGKWRSDDVDTLITYFRENPLLWDSSLTEHRSRTARNVALECLSRKIGYRKSAADLMAKWENLRTTFNGQIKKGHTGDEGKTTKPWPYLKDLMFLKKTGFQRKSFTNSKSLTAEGDYTNAERSVDTVADDLTSEVGSPALDASGQSIFDGVVIKRKHRQRGGGDDEQDKLKQKLLKCLDEKPDGLVAFGSNVAETLRKFNDTNQEFVKAQIQYVLAISLQKQSQDQDMPVFGVI